MGWRDWLPCCSSDSGLRTRSARAASAFRSTTDRGAASLYFEDAYEPRELLGEGKTGRVYRVRAYQSPRFEAAAKVVRKEYLSTPQRRLAFAQELDILKRVNHPSVLKLLDIFDDEEKFVIVTERIHGGDLLDVMCRVQERPLRECDVAFVIRELLSVVAYLHKLHITHRDIKLDNVMCRTNDMGDGIVLIDFGLAHKGRNGEMSGMNGTVHYMAPEMFGRDSQYGNEIDVWAVGVLAYLLLFGKFPFDAKFMSQVEDKIVAGNYEFPPELVNEVSPQAIKFIEYLLAVNPHDRPPAAMALQHPWMQVEHISTAPFSDAHMAALHGFYAANRGSTGDKATNKGTKDKANGHHGAANRDQRATSNASQGRHGPHHGPANRDQRATSTASQGHYGPHHTPANRNQRATSTASQGRQGPQQSRAS